MKSASVSFVVLTARSIFYHMLCLCLPYLYISIYIRKFKLFELFGFCLGFSVVVVFEVIVVIGVAENVELMMAHTFALPFFSGHSIQKSWLFNCQLVLLWMMFAWYFSKKVFHDFLSWIQSFQLSCENLQRKWKKNIINLDFIQVFCCWNFCLRCGLTSS